MTRERHFDDYMEKIKIETEEISELSHQRIIDSTLNRINTDTEDHKEKPIVRWHKTRYIAAVCIMLILLSGLIPSTPVNALYRNIFKFIPGVGIVESEEGYNISLATGKSYRIESDNGFLEIKYAYILNDMLYISAVSNVGYTDIEDFSNKEEVLEKFHDDSFPRIYILSGDEKIYIKNYMRSGPVRETGAAKMSGAFFLEGELLNETIFVLGIDGLEKQVSLVLEDLEDGYSPGELGNYLYIDDVLIFADLNRDGDIAVLNMSSVIPEQYYQLRFHMYDSESDLYGAGIKILDNTGVSYYPNDDMRKNNNDTGNNFYFEIPEEAEGLKVVIPQIFYDTRVIGDTVVKMPKLDEYIPVDEVFVFDSMRINFKGLTLLSYEDDDIVDREFGEDTLRLDFEADYDEGSIHRVSRIVPRISIKRAFNDYDLTSAHGHFPYWELNQQEGSYYTIFDGMEDASKVLVEIKMTNTVIGPFEIEL